MNPFFSLALCQSGWQVCRCNCNYWEMIWIVKSPPASSAGKIFGFRLQLGRSGLRLSNISTIAVFLGAGSWLSTIYLSIPFQESEQEPSAHQFRCEATGASEPAQCARHPSHHLSGEWQQCLSASYELRHVASCWAAVFTWNQLRYARYIRYDQICVEVKIWVNHGRCFGSYVGCTTGTRSSVGRGCVSDCLCSCLRWIPASAARQRCSHAQSNSAAKCTYF